MQKLLFIGDSFTAGENNNFISYVQYIDKSYDSTQIGVPGTTIGEYSLYLPKGYSLLSQIEKHKDTIAKVDTIYLEYVSMIFLQCLEIKHHTKKYQIL